MRSEVKGRFVAKLKDWDEGNELEDIVDVKTASPGGPQDGHTTIVKNTRVKGKLRIPSGSQVCHLRVLLHCSGT